MIDAIRYARAVCDDDDCTLSNAARAVLIWTATYCDTRTGDATIGVRHLAKLSGYSPFWANKAQHELVEAGVLNVRQRSGCPAIWVFPVRSNLRPQASTSLAHPAIHNRATGHPQRATH